jgi:hypothetical protein
MEESQKDDDKKEGKDSYIGRSFDDFLREEGILEEVKRGSQKLTEEWLKRKKGDPAR